MAGRTLGSAWISVQPAGFATFGTKTAAGVKAATRGVQGTVPISPDVKGFGPAIAKLRAELAALGKSHAGGVFDLVDLNASPAQIMSQLRLLKRMIGQAGVSDLISANLNTSQIEEQLAKLKHLTDLSVGVDTTDAVTAVEELRARLGVLTGNLSDLRFGADTTEAAAAIARLQAQAAALGKRVNNVKFGGDTSQLVSAEARLLAIQAAYERLAPAEQDAQKATGLFNDAISKGLPLVTGFGTGLYGLGGHVTLFGGALTSIGIPAIISAASGLHLVSEAVIETAGTLIPAAVAFGAFGAAAIPTIQSIYTQMQNLHTVSTGLGTALYPLTGNFQAVAAAVQPQVYELFGQALYLAGRNTGTFLALATGAGKVLDDLGARFTYAITQGRGFSTFVHSAIGDLRGWGTLVGNLGGIIGGLLKVLPGYAQDLLNVAQGLTHVIEGVINSGFGQWILSVGLAAHGALFYLGLLATGAAFLARSLLSGVASAALAAASGLVRFGAAGEAASEGMLAFGAAAEGAAALPWGWISLAVTGLALLALQLGRSKDAVEQFNAAQQQAIQNASLDKLTATITAAQAASAAEVAKTTGTLTKATDAYASSLKSAAPVMNLHTGELSQQQSALAGAVKAQSEAVAGQQAINATSQLVNSRMAGLARQYGGATNALALLNAAGITSDQITSKSNQTWGEAQIEIQAAQDAMRAMSLGTGRSAAAMNALGNTFLTSTVPAIQKFTSAEDAAINVLTAAPDALDTFQQGIYTLAQNFNQATGSGQSVSFTLDHIKSKASLAGATLAGTSQASYALNQSFFAQVQNGQKLIDSLQQQGIGTKDLTTAVATLAGQMLGFAGNNAEARSVILALIDNALGPGVVSMQSMNKWVGANSTSLSGFNTIVAKSTISAGNLAGVLQGSLNNMLAQAAVDALGGQKALDQFARGVLNGDSAATLLASDGGAQVTRMFKQMYGSDAPKAEAAFVSWAKNGLGLSQGAATSLWNELNGQLSPQLQGLTGKTVPGAQGAFASWAKNGLGLSQGAANTLWNEVQTHLGPQLQGLTNKNLPQVQAAFMRWAVGPNSTLKLTQDQARNLWGELVTLQTHIDSLHGKSITIAAIAQGKGGVSVTASGLAAKEISISNRALGGLIDAGTGPTADDVPAMLSKGELVVPAWMVNAGLVDHLKGRLPGFASGGLVGLANGVSAFPPPVGSAYGSDVQAILAADLQAEIQAQFKAAAARGAIAGSYNGPGTLSATQIEGIWEQAGGPGGQVANIAQAITVPESGRRPGAVQQGQPYATTGWGLWQITPGNSEPQFGVNAQLLVPINNARAAVAKYTQAGFSFSPWTTYVNGLYRPYLLAMGGLVGYAAGGKVSGKGSRPPVPPTRGGHGSRPPVPPLAYKAFLASLKHTQGLEYRDWSGLWWSFLRGPKRYLDPKTLTSLRIAEKDEYAEQLAVKAILAHSTGSVADINAQPGLVAKLHAAVTKEQAALKPKILSRLPGGHPGWIHGLDSHLAALAGLSAPGKAALQSWVPTGLGPVHSVPGGGVLQFRDGGQVFDRGGWLKPGPNLTWNMTGAPEHLTNDTGASAGGDVHIHVDNHGWIGSEAQMQGWLTRQLNQLARTGKLSQSVRTALK